MADSNSFTSLSALANSHLSKTSIQNNNSDGVNGLPRRIPIPSLNGFRPGTLSETSLATGRVHTLPLLISDSSIRNVLEEQISNMLKAQEKKKQIEEDNLRLAENMNKLKVEEDFEIDLVAAMQDSEHCLAQCGPGPSNDEVISCSGSEGQESFEFIDCDVELERSGTPVPSLPCVTDMSFLLKQKIKMGKCSVFGKVLTSTLRPVAAPYLHERVRSKIRPFKFKTKSPCDVLKEKMHWKPSMSTRCTFDVTTFLL